MGTMTIDGRKVEFTDEKNVLTVIRKAGTGIKCFGRFLAAAAPR